MLYLNILTFFKCHNKYTYIFTFILYYIIKQITIFINFLLPLSHHIFGNLFIFYEGDINILFQLFFNPFSTLIYLDIIFFFVNLIKIRYLFLNLLIYFIKPRYILSLNNFILVKKITFVFFSLYRYFYYFFKCILIYFNFYVYFIFPYSL